MVANLSDGATAFVAGLRLCNCDYNLREQVVVFAVTAVIGVHSGERVETGVAVDDLAGWPIAPPHWIHLPDHIAVSPTNARLSPIQGWMMHSRNLAGWGNAREPAQAWLAHVQAVLGMAEHAS